MDENPYKAPATMQTERKRYSAFNIAWLSFEILAISVLVAPFLFAPDEIKTPAQKEMWYFAESLMIGGWAMLAILVLPLGIWAWRRRKLG